MTWPLVSTSGPPESPGWMAASVSTNPCSVSVRVPRVAGGDRLVERRDRAGHGGRGAALAEGVADGHDRAADVEVRRVAGGHGLEPRGVLQLEQGDVVGDRVAEHRGRVRPAGAADLGVDGGGVLDDVVVGEHQPADEVMTMPVPAAAPPWASVVVMSTTAGSTWAAMADVFTPAGELPLPELEPEPEPPGMGMTPDDCESFVLPFMAYSTAAPVAAEATMTAPTTMAATPQLPMGLRVCAAGTAAGGAVGVLRGAVGVRRAVGVLRGAVGVLRAGCREEPVRARPSSRRPRSPHRRRRPAPRGVRAARTWEARSGRLPGWCRSPGRTGSPAPRPSGSAGTLAGGRTGRRDFDRSRRSATSALFGQSGRRSPPTVHVAVTTLAVHCMPPNRPSVWSAHRCAGIDRFVVEPVSELGNPCGFPWIRARAKSPSPVTAAVIGMRAVLASARIAVAGRPCRSAGGDEDGAYEARRPPRRMKATRAAGWCRCARHGGCPLHDAVTGRHVHRPTLVELEVELALDDDGEVDRVGAVHARVVRFELGHQVGHLGSGPLPRRRPDRSRGVGRGGVGREGDHPEDRTARRREVCGTPAIPVSSGMDGRVRSTTARSSRSPGRGRG